MRMPAVSLALLLLAVPVAATAQQRRCSDTKNPKNLPAVSALVDSTRAIRELGEIPAEGMLFSLLYSEQDSFPRTSVLVAPTEQAGVVLSQSLLAQKPDKMWAVRVRVTGGATPALTLERSTYCPPMVEPSTRQLERFSVQLQRGDRMPPPSGNVRITAEMVVQETGVPAAVRLLQQSGIRELDDQFLAHWQLQRFYPALVDGIAIPAWYRSNGQTLKL